MRVLIHKAVKGTDEESAECCKEKPAMRCASDRSGGSAWNTQGECRVLQGKATGDRQSDEQAYTSEQYMGNQECAPRFVLDIFAITLDDIRCVRALVCVCARALMCVCKLCEEKCHVPCLLRLRRHHARCW